MTIGSLPGISASNWIYLESEGEEVLFRDQWTFSGTGISKKVMKDAAAENNGIMNGDDYPDPSSGNLGPWDWNGDGEWYLEPWYDYVSSKTFDTYTWELGEGAMYATRANYEEALDYLNQLYDEVEFVSLPGFAASEWIYSEEAGEEVLY